MHQVWTRVLLLSGKYLTCSKSSPLLSFRSVAKLEIGAQEFASQLLEPLLLILCSLAWLLLIYASVRTVVPTVWQC